MTEPLHGGMFRLSNMEFDEISLVAAGDDPMARVLIAKAAPADAVEKAGRSTLERAPGDSDNWVESVGGLPAYIRKIAEALHEDGMPVSRAIATAVSKVQEWAGGGGNVQADTRAKAAKAVAEWESKKARARLSKSTDVDAALITFEKSAEVHAGLPTFETKAPQGEDSTSMSEPITADAANETTDVTDVETTEVIVEAPDAADADVEATDATEAVENADETNETAEVVEKSEAATDIPVEVVDYIEALEDEIVALTASLEIAKAAQTEVEPIAKSEEDVMREAIEKADPAVRAIIEKAQAAEAEAREIAKAAQEAETQREYIAKAASFAGLGQDAATMAGLLRAIDEHLPTETATSITEVLRTAQTQVTKSGLFAEVGVDATETTVTASLQAAADEIRKTDPTLTPEMARVRAMEANPHLYTSQNGAN